MPRPRKLVWKEIRYGRKYRDISFPKPQPTKKKARRNRRNNVSGGQGGPTPPVAGGTTPPAAGGSEKVDKQTAPDLKGGTRMSRKTLCMGLVEALHLMEKCNDDCYAQIKQDRRNAGLKMNELRIQDALSSHCRYATRSHVGSRSLLIAGVKRRLRCMYGIR